MYTYKKANFKAQGLQVYKAFAFGEFSHYCYKKPVYKLVETRTLNGIERKEIRLKGKFQYQYFYRGKKENGYFETWEEFANYWKKETRLEKESKVS